jgi:hypothetical protein
MWYIRVNVDSYTSEGNAINKPCFPLLSRICALWQAAVAKPPIISCDSNFFESVCVLFKKVLALLYITLAPRTPSFELAFCSCVFECVCMRRFILNLSPISYRSTRSFYQLRLHSTMSTSVSRSQPKWHLPAQKESPVLKLQNSLTKTKVYVNAV